MTFQRFTKDARAVVAAARDEAQTAEQGTIEAEHLLLALASHPHLCALGLDRDELADALDREDEHSLAAVGIAAVDYGAPATRRRRFNNPRMATSAKVALERALAAAVQRRDRSITARHLLIGVLAAEHGRVPRTLALADIDVAELRGRI
jgi:ATP-dependent Clp protease ATP-binding subunit ClpA